MLTGFSITQLRQINPDVTKCYGIAVAWELKVIASSVTKDQYLEQMAAKMREITAKRQQAVGGMNMPGNMGMMPNNMMNMPHGMMNMPNMQGMQNNNGMGNMQNMHNMQNMQNNGMGNMNFQNGGNMSMQGGRMQQGQNPMAQLQRQMQASPLPMQQQPQQPQQPGTLDPSTLQMSQQGNQQQQPSNQQSQNMGQPTQPQQPTMSQNGQVKPGAALQQEIAQLARQYSDNMRPEQKAEVRARFTATLNDAQKAQLAAQGTDPLIRFVFQRAQSDVMKRRQQMGTMQSKPDLNNGNMNNGNMNNGNMNQMGNVPPRPPSQNAGQNIDFSSIMGQQANAMKLQDAGEQVVPASNNNNGNNGNNGNMNFGNGMNMPQNVNPQMLGNNNQGQQGGNPQMSQNQMQLIMMQQRANQERMNKQLQAQQHAMASRQQHSQLQGQPGGLHTPNGFGGSTNGQVNSPAMSMLNRPIVPPGQTTPGTPQPNRQQTMPSTPMNNGVSQLQQHHQNMLNQNNQQQQQQQQQMNQTGQNSTLNVQQLSQQQFQELLQRVPPQFRQKLGQMPQHEARDMLQKFHAQSVRQRQQQQNQQGMPNNMMNGMNVGPSQQGNQQQPGSMPQQNMSNAIPGFNSQPPPNQINMDPAAQLQQRIQREQQVKLRSQAMDIRPFPKPVLTQLGIAVPPNVQLWGHLKQHVLQNSPQGTIDKVNQQQAIWFQSNPQEYQVAMAAMMARIKMNSATQQGQQGQPGQNQQTQQNGAVPPPASMQDRPAPPAQMVPPAPMMQSQGQSMPPSDQGPRPMPNMPTVSPHDLAMFRSKVPQAGGMSDDQIRQVLIRQKLEKMRQQHQLQRQSLQTAQMQKPPGPTDGNNNSAGIGMPQQSTPQPPPAQASVGQPKAQKQGSNDVVEISSMPVSQTAPQAPPMQASQSQNQGQQSQQPFKPLNKDQIQQLSEKDRQTYLQKMQRTVQMENLRKAQGQMGVANGQAGQQPGQQQRSQMSPAHAERIKSLQAEVTRTFKRGNPVQCDATTLEKAKIMLKKLYHPLHQISHTFPAALNLGFDDNVVKRLMRAILLITSNVMDSSGNLKDYLSVSPEELADTERLVAGYMTELKRRKEQSDSMRQAASMQTQGAKPAPGTSSAGMARTASQQNHVRKALASNKAPPAPTDNKTFDWAAPSPHGVPKYEPGRNELTPDKLKFPPQKKRKTDQAGSQASTPAAQAGTPAAGAGASPALTNGKMQSPDQARKTPAQIKAEADKAAERKKFVCTDNMCEAALHGFDTEEQLKQHQEAQHKAVEDPLQFLLDNAATALGVDQDGKPLQRSQLIASTVKATAAPKNKEGQKKPDAGSKDAPKRAVSLSEAMAQKLGVPAAAEPLVEEVKIEEDFVGPFLLPTEIHQPGVFDSTPYVLGQMLADGWLEDPDHMGVFYLRPGAHDQGSSPSLTPSEASQGSQNSDISQSDAVNFNLWLENMDADMLGDSKQGVPEGMVPLFEQMENINMMKEREDVHMSNTDDDKTDGDASKKRKAPQTWQPPVADFMQSFFDEANLDFS